MKRILLAGFFICAFAVAAVAQSNSGVTGVVTDPQGARVVGATVTLTDTKTSKDFTTTTDDSGVYRFEKVPPGEGYKITFSQAGFQTLVLSNITLGVLVTETHNAQLTVGATDVIVEVTDQGGATLNTTDASIGNVIEERRLKDLPIQLRNSPAALLGLQPGVVGNNVGAGGGNRGGSVTGSRADQGNITIDGIDANDQTTGQAFATVGNAPIDAIQEFRGITSNPSAAEGRSSGGQIELVTKSGTNEFHGSLREYNRTAKTAANSFFNNRRGRFADGSLVSPRPQLTRNQFGGSIGGPVLKDKLFFFFDYEGRRDAQGVSYTRIVPLPHVREGRIAFLNAVSGCPTNARLSTHPQCITILSQAQVAALDPRGTGSNAALVSFLASRYPLPNDLSLGNGVNTAGFSFNAPSRRLDNTYTSRYDWNATEKQKLFVRWNIARRVQTDTVNSVAQQFPGDPETAQIVVKDYAWVAGHTWVLTSNLINQATVGLTHSGLDFPNNFQPAFPNSFTFGGGLTAPYAGISSQDRNVDVPTIRDDVSWTKGSHSFSFGTQIKPISQKSGLVNDFNFVGIGLGGLTGNLNSASPTVRPAQFINAVDTPACVNNPACLGAGATRSGAYDAIFAFMLGRMATLTTNFNYGVDGNAFAPGTGKKRDFRYNEYEFYFQDNWRVRNDLTLTYGVRYHLASPPYEKNGFQACNDIDFENLWNIRQQNAARGLNGETIEPLLRYDLCGKGNGLRDYHATDLNNWAPRLSVAWNPSFKDGLLGRILGDRKTSIRAGSSIVYDRVGGAVTFIQDQVSYLFDNSATRNFGAPNARNALLNDPRFTGINSLPVNNTAPVITRPFTPFTNDPACAWPGPSGLCTGEFNYAVDQQFRIPYSIQYSAGFQREMPGNFILEMSYVGRQSRKLFSQADLSQVVDHRDPASGQMMLTAFNNLQAGSTAAQPWIENQVNPAIQAIYGAPCTAFGFANCTALVLNDFGGPGSLIEVGGTGDLVQQMFAFGYIRPNVGMGAQFADNVYISNQGSSTYNGMLVSVRKRFSQGFQFDFNYTLSHAIDNGSSITNTVTGGIVCDLTNLRVCRGDSDFDIRHLWNVNGIWELPFGRGKLIGGNVPGWANQIIGGWELTGIFTARSGLAFSVNSGAFPRAFTFNSPAAISGGDLSALRGNIHDGTGGTSGAVGTIQYFANPLAVFNPTTNTGILRYPHHGEIGNRNIFRGPSFWNADMALLKNFNMPWEGHRIQIRAEAYNVFNHNSFGLPNATMTSASFGQITTSATGYAPREFQFAFRYEF